MENSFLFFFVRTELPSQLLPSPLCLANFFVLFLWEGFAAEKKEKKCPLMRYQVVGLGGSLQQFKKKQQS